MVLKPLNNLVLIEELEAETTSRGGIALALARDNDVSRGKVLAVGPDVVGLKKNDVVAYLNADSNRVQGYILVNTENVLCKEVKK